MPQSLYQINVLTYPGIRNQFILPPGVLGVIEVDLVPGTSMVLTTNQLIPDVSHMPQDRTMLAWISDMKGGNPVVTTPPESGWHLTALQKTLITIYDGTAGLGPYDGMSISLLPGTYWLNVLNLVNETNGFFYDFTTGA
jgi:hypothetical protein